MSMHTQAVVQLARTFTSPLLARLLARAGKLPDSAPTALALVGTIEFCVGVASLWMSYTTPLPMVVRVFLALWGTRELLETVVMFLLTRVSPQDLAISGGSVHVAMSESDEDSSNTP